MKTETSTTENMKIVGGGEVLWNIVFIYNEYKKLEKIKALSSYEGREKQCYGTDLLTQEQCVFWERRDCHGKFKINNSNFI